MPRIAVRTVRGLKTIVLLTYFLSRARGSPATGLRCIAVYSQAYGLANGADCSRAAGALSSNFDARIISIDEFGATLGPSQRSKWRSCDSHERLGCTALVAASV